MNPGSKSTRSATDIRRPAITLVEVATCMVSLAILSGISLAALARVRGASQNEVCLNNLRLIAAASADYSANDPRDNAIPIHPRAINAVGVVIGDYQYGGKSGNVDSVSNYIYTVEGWFGTWTRPLNPLLYNVDSLVSPECRDYNVLTQACIDADKAVDVPIFRCPSDTGWTGLHFAQWANSGRSAYDYFGTSYQANMQLICTGANSGMRSNSPFLRPREDVPNPARTISYMETNGRFAWTWGFAPLPYGTIFTVGGWHGEDWRFNVAVVDGHAKSVTMKGAANGGEVNSAADAEFVPGLPGGMAPWWQIIMRGPEWQLDTLPSPPIDTGKRCGGGFTGDTADDVAGGSMLRPADLTP